MDGMPTAPSFQDTLGKRKRDDDSDDDTKENVFVNENEDEGFDESNDDDVNANMSASEEDDKSNDDSDSDSDEDEDEDDEENSKYNESGESFPREPAYDDDVPKIQKQCTNIASEIEAFLSQSNCSTEAVTNFQAKAAELKTFPTPDPIKVGMLGATGVGTYTTDMQGCSYSLF
jgi:hypothetical protein